MEEIFINWDHRFLFCLIFSLYLAVIFWPETPWMQHFLLTFFTSFWAVSIFLSLALAPLLCFAMITIYFQWWTLRCTHKFRENVFEFRFEKETTITEEIKWMKPKVLLIVCYTLFSSLCIYSFHLWNFVYIFSWRFDGVKWIEDRS